MVTLVTSVSAFEDHVDMRPANISQDYSGELSRDSMIHYVYPIQELSEFLLLYELS